MQYLVKGAASSGRRLAGTGTGRLGVANGDRSDGTGLVGDSEAATYRILVLEEPEEAAAQADLDHEKLEGQGGERRIGQPVRNRPGLRSVSQTGGSLVSLGVAGQVTAGDAERHDDGRSDQETGPWERRPPLCRQGRLPVGSGIGALKDEELDPLAVSCRRGPTGGIDQVVQQAGVEGLRGERSAGPSISQRIGDGHGECRRRWIRGTSRGPRRAPSRWPPARRRWPRPDHRSRQPRQAGSSPA